MNIFAIFLLTSLTVSASSIYSQEVEFNLELRNARLIDVFNAIEENSEFIILYDENQIDVNQKVNVNVKDQKVEKVLNQVLENTKCNYVINDRQIAIVAKKAERESRVAAPAAIQPRTIVKGRVNAENGDVLPGVSIIVKGTKSGTTTDVNGNYSIELNQNAKTLVFSFVGMLTQEVLVGNRSTINVVLTEENTGLDEVIVVGYGTVKKRDLTGAVSSVKSQDIVLRPGPNPMEALQGKVAGLDITRTSGEPGSELTMQLRGTRSFTASGTPLFLINGLPGDYSTLNPNDIQSIEVLKDASSTAVYGSAGSNGVIIITTKSAEAGKLNVNLNAYYGYNGWSITPTMRSGDSYLQAKRDAYSYVWDATSSAWTKTGALWQTAADDETIFGTDRYAIYQEGQFVNWADEFLQKSAATQNYSLSVSGGNDKTKAYVSFNYTDEKGQYRGDDLKLYSTNMRVDHKLKDWALVGSNIQLSYMERNIAQDKLENALVTDPLAKVYNDDGTLNTDLGNNVYNLLLNYQPGVYDNKDKNTKIYINPYLEIKPMKGLSFLSRASLWLNYSNNYRFDGIGSVNYTYVNAGITKAGISQNNSLGYQWENILTYNFKLAQDHDFTLTGVSTWNHNQKMNTSMSQSNVLTNDFKWYNFTGDVNTTALSSYTMAKTLGFVGRLNYSYLGKYLMSASIRRDGSSVLYYTNRWDNFPAVSAAWRISEENFMASTKSWMDNLKLRVGYGITGSAKIEPYSSVNTLVSSNMSLGGVTQPNYYYSQFITNTALSWEKSYNTNIGIDASFLNNRVDVVLDLYNTRTDGVIWSVTSPSIYGTFTPGKQYQTNMNICQTNNKGLELTVNTRNVVTKDFEWTSSLIYSYNKEEILKLTNGIADNITNGDYALSIGQPVNSFYNYKLDGVWQLGEEKDAAVFGKRPGDLKVNVPDMERLAEGVYLKTVTATDGTVTSTYYYTDLATAQQHDATLTSASSKYSYSAKDYQVLGHNSPSWSFGFQNGFKYKNFDLSVYMYFRWGQMINYKMLGWYQPNGFATNASPSRTIPEYFNYWTPENPSNDFPVMNYLSTASSMTGFSGLNYVDGSFFKIKNITLGYSVPSKTLKELKIEKLRLYSTMTNPLIVAKSDLLQQYDPEMNGELSYPLTKQVVVGVNLTF